MRILVKEFKFTIFIHTLFKYNEHHIVHKTTISCLEWWNQTSNPLYLCYSTFHVHIMSTGVDWNCSVHIVRVHNQTTHIEADIYIFFSLRFSVTLILLLKSQKSFFFFFLRKERMAYLYSDPQVDHIQFKKHKYKHTWRRGVSV